MDFFRIGPLTDDGRNFSDPSLARTGTAKREVSEWHRMTADALKDCNKRYLAQLAKEQGITGWHAMRKDQLIRALSLPRSVPAHKKAKTASRPQATPHRKPAAEPPGARGRATPHPAPAIPSH